MELEENCLMMALEEILEGMAGQLPDAQQEYGQGLLAESLLDVDLYLAVALSLLQGAPAATQFGQRERVSSILSACSAEEMRNFPLFGCEREMDFSQFKPRGHYQKSERLQRYFRAMMWVGRIDLRVAGGDNPKETTQRQLGTAILLLDFLRRGGKFAAWQQFDRLLQTFIGVTDSLTFAQLEDLLQQSDIRTPADISHWAMLEQLQDNILAGDAGYQEIVSDLYLSDPASPEQTMLPHSFTLMGQKFTLDSWALGQVVFDRVLWEDEKVMRRVPSCLDVAFAVLGNTQVMPDLVARMSDSEGRLYRDGLPYQKNLAAMRDLLDAQDESVWEASLYTRWLHCLRALSCPTTGPEYPEALHTRAWASKSLNTQLASWAHLRHDTILYVKQSYTMSTLCFYPAGYVEPNPLLWERLEGMASHGADVLAQAALPQTTHTDPLLPREALQSRQYAEAMTNKQAAFLRQFAETVRTLREIAAKQAAQTALTEEETKFLQNIVQIVETHGSGARRYYNGWYPGLFYAGPEKCAEADALVADVHTNTPSQWPPDPGCILHQGVGGVDLLVIAVENGEDRLVFAGPTLSHYEFEMPGSARLSDSEWKAALQAGRFPDRPEWTRSYLVPADHLPSQYYVPSLREQAMPISPWNRFQIRRREL